MSNQTGDEPTGSPIRAEQTLKQLNETWVRALINKDTAALDQLMDEWCFFTDALSGDDKAQFIADIDSGDLQITSLSRDNVEVRVYGSTGVLTGLDTADWHYKGRHIQGHYRSTHVYAQRDGIWKIVAIQSSPIEVR